MDGLVRLAERCERMILHEEREGLHIYLLEDEGVLYRYRAGRRPEESGFLELPDWNGAPPPHEAPTFAEQIHSHGRVDQ
jgi:hypothetical protein